MSRELTKHNDNNTAPVVRMVPIKLLDGKVIQRQPEESVEIKAEFTNFSHQEFDGDNNEPAASPVIPRLDEKNENELSNSNNKEERVVVVPIKLMETGETIMPTFSKLEDPQPPDWSTFSKLNKAKEKEVPLKTPSSPLQQQPPPSPAAAEDTAGGQERCRSSRRSSKQTVRFDLDEDNTSSSKRSSSVETYTRSSTSVTKPPTMPASPSRKSRLRTASAERPQRDHKPNHTTERTLQEIDRDINQIWRELQELEKLPNGSRQAYKAASQQQQQQATAHVAPPVTPVRVRATYTPCASTPKKYSPSPGRRTIWDMDSNGNTTSSRPGTPKLDPSSPRLPPPPIPPHLRPQNIQPPASSIKMAPIARDESFYDIASKSPSTASCYDNEYSPNSGKFKGFPYIDGAPRKQQSVSCSSNGNAAAASNGSHKDTTVLSTQNNNFSLLVDKSTQTQELEKRSKMAKEACAIL